MEKFLRPNPETGQMQVEGTKAEIEKILAETKTQNQVLAAKLPSNFDMREGKSQLACKKASPFPRG